MVGTDLAPLFDAMLEHVPAHDGSPDDPLQLQICSLDYSTYVGRIGIGRVNQGTLEADAGGGACTAAPTARRSTARVNQVLKFEGLERKQATEAGPGDIVLVNGIEDIGIGVTLTEPREPGAAADAEGRRADADDELLRQQLAAGRPRRQVRHQPADLGPPAARTAEQRRAASVSETDEDGIFEVMGRGELHLTILLETMRREGYELAVSKPRVVFQREGWRAPRADRAGHRRRRGPAPGRRDAGARRAQGRARQHGAGRHGPRAPGVPHPGARPDRLPERVPEPDPRHRA